MRAPPPNSNPGPTRHLLFEDVSKKQTKISCPAPCGHGASSPGAMSSAVPDAQSPIEPNHQHTRCDTADPLQPVQPHPPVLRHPQDPSILRTRPRPDDCGLNYHRKCHRVIDMVQREIIFYISSFCFWQMPSLQHHRRNDPLTITCPPESRPVSSLASVEILALHITFGPPPLCANNAHNARCCFHSLWDQ